MPIFGFDEGKNKEEVHKSSEVYTKNEVYTKEEVNSSLDNKVDKIEGKGLSTEDYTSAEKQAVSTISGKQNQHTTQVKTLSASSWSNKSQTISVTGVTATNTVLVSPAPSSIALYAAAGIICTAQGARTLTFTCDFTPSSNISINVVILGV